MFRPQVLDDEGGEPMDPRDWPAPPVSAYAADRLPGFAAVLSARPLQLDCPDQLELLTQAGACLAQLDFVRCQAISALVLTDNRSPLVIRAQQQGRRGGLRLRRLGGDGTPECSEALPSEVGLAVGCSEAEATRLIALSLDLKFRLRHTSHHFSAGRISMAHARVIAEVTRPVPDRVVERIEEQLAEAALTRTPGRLRMLAKRRVAKSDPAAFAARHRQARADRCANMFGLGDGMAAFSVNHQLDTIAVVDDQLEAWARQRVRTDPSVSFSAHKADAAVCLLLARHPLTGRPLIANNQDASRHNDVDSATEASTNVAAQSSTGVSTVADPTNFVPGRTELRVHLTADTLLGIGDDSCDLEGLGPVTVGQARRLALASAATVLRRVFCDPADGSVLFLDPRRYRFTSAQSETVRALHPVSTFPGSTVSARKCDIDHAKAYASGPSGGPDPPGQTVVTNAQPLHRRGHRLKTHGGWRLAADPDDPHTCTWTSPYGRRYTVADHDGG